MEGKGTVPLYSADSGALSGGMLSAKFIGDYVRATLRETGNVPRIPPYHIGGGLQWQSDPFDIGFLLKYAGRQSKISIGETPTKGYVNLDANIAVRPFPMNRQIEFSIVGHNLTNAVQRDAVSINKDLVVLPGRDVRFSVRMDF
jgi:iron complex outermembrane receptor protein